jgi:hypothetical protein
MALTLQLHLNQQRGPFEHLQLETVRVAVLGGGQMGVQAYLALMSIFFRGLILVAWVWPDWINNSKKRFYRHSGEKLLNRAKDESGKWAKAKYWLDLLTPTTGTKKQQKRQKLCGRILQQLVMFDAVIGPGGMDEQDIVFGQYSDEKMLKLLLTKDEFGNDVRLIDVVIICAFGAAIGKEVIRRFKAAGGKIIIDHPSRALTLAEEDDDVLPEDCRAAKAIEGIVEQEVHECQYQWHLIDCGEVTRVGKESTGWDSGRRYTTSGGKRFASSEKLNGPVFGEHLRGPEGLPERVNQAVLSIASEAGRVLRHNIIQILWTLDELLAVTDPETIASMEQVGWTLPEIKEHMNPSVID